MAQQFLTGFDEPPPEPTPKPCASGHVWSNQFGEDWHPDEGTPCDCGEKRWNVHATVLAAPVRVEESKPVAPILIPGVTHDIDGNPWETYPTVNCPRCGASHEDLDGVGVVHCASCGYCTHASIDGDVCGLCGETVTDSPDVAVYGFGAAKDQGLLADMFEPDALDQLRAAQAFKRVDTDLDPDFRCPACHFGWRGNPKPPIAGDVE